MVYILGPMVENTKVNIFKIRNMDKELILGQLARNIQVGGKMESNMDDAEWDALSDGVVGGPELAEDGRGLLGHWR